MKKLYHRDTLIGTITDYGPNGMETGGTIQLTKEAEKFSELFAFFMDAKNDAVDPSYAEEMLWNWFVEDDKGARDEIGLPGLYEKGGKTLVYWRCI